MTDKRNWNRDEGPRQNSGGGGAGPVDEEAKRATTNEPSSREGMTEPSRQGMTEPSSRESSEAGTRSGTDSESRNL